MRRLEPAGPQTPPRPQIDHLTGRQYHQSETRLRCWLGWGMWLPRKQGFSPEARHRFLRAGQGQLCHRDGVTGAPLRGQEGLETGRAEVPSRSWLRGRWQCPRRWAEGSQASASLGSMPWRVWGGPTSPAHGCSRNEHSRCFSLLFCRHLWVTKFTVQCERCRVLSRDCAELRGGCPAAAWR